MDRWMPLANHIALIFLWAPQSLINIFQACDARSDFLKALNYLILKVNSSTEDVKIERKYSQRTKPLFAL